MKRKYAPPRSRLEFRGERIMTVEVNSGGGGNAVLAFLLGAVLVAVGVIGFFMWDNFKSHQGAATAPASSIHLTVKK
jgi:hypothetical protein